MHGGNTVLLVLWNVGGLRWAGDVARMWRHGMHTGFWWGKRPLGRPRRRWEDNIKMYLRCEDGRWRELTRDHVQWRALVIDALSLLVLLPVLIQGHVTLHETFSYLGKRFHCLQSSRWPCMSDSWWREKFPAPTGTRTPNHPARSPALYHWAIPAPLYFNKRINYFGYFVKCISTGESPVPVILDDRYILCYSTFCVYTCLWSEPDLQDL
jgi:hypothetical protein